MKNLPSVKAISFKNADVLISQLSKHKEAWLQVEIPERIIYLRYCLDGVQKVAAKWIERVCLEKGIDPTKSLAGEEWLAGPMVIVRNLRLLIEALEAFGQPKPKRWITRPDGQVVAQVLPGSFIDNIFWMGFTGEVWIEPGKPTTQGLNYRKKHDKGSVALILEAGNNLSLSLTDTLYKLFVEDQVVIIKISQINEYDISFIEEAFRSLIEDGFFKVVYGDAELGSYLCHHPEIDTVHITGSDCTHDAIVWGKTFEEQLQRKASNQPLLKKPITSELGCVTPVLVVPGVWSKSDLIFQARHVASMVTHNASFNCDAAKVLVTAKGWKQRDTFLEILHQELAAIPTRKAYYPGARERYEAFLDQYPQAQALVYADEESIPWTVIPQVPPKTGEYALNHEAFCGLLAEVTLDAEDPGEFLAKAVNFANQKVKGTLSCVLLVHPKTEKAYSAEIDRAIANLRYGGIGVNVWTGIIYALGLTTWGAFPGNTLTDIGSGRGVVHNAYMFDHPQKSVVRSPFRIYPTPAWFVTHKNLLQLGQRVTAFEAYPTWGKLLDVVFAALKG
ncbi:aldehyde dehydrogenase family protein [Nostoc sp. ATCC 53789]|uniref:aldehyde dehydrogenase family protein n=1 Tax=Nostoc sp. ATCC 53789 TaxID=76335 RepID=UPI000DEC0B4A|nr:aldehyde dehydrogenase family protein [Nostoc sp. ATCC 53789]QHG16068.1 aldehyde dehydrogenase family protein [Nostoc sp. ATCC 53789]RCJ17213.1 NAD-dependent aldehyde dehydrogenase [Nostoc sp. ATCC 53789]